MKKAEVHSEGSVSERTAVVCVDVDPGICGFNCSISVFRPAPWSAEIEINGSKCQQIQKFSINLGRISLKDFFMPLMKNPVFLAMQVAGCHNSCAVPLAVLKAVEVSLEVALPKAVKIRFLSIGE